MSAISGLSSSTASQYQTDTQSPWQHHGNGVKAHQGASKPGNLSAQQTLQKSQQTSSQMANVSGRNSQTPTTFKVLQDAFSSGRQQNPYRSGMEEPEQYQGGSENSPTKTDSSTSVNVSAQTAGGLLDVLA